MIAIRLKRWAPTVLWKIQHDLPVGYSRTISCAAWMDHHFGDKVAAAVNGTPFEKQLIYAIACQETAICWNAWINDHTPEEILARCVFDASGDVNGTRLAFPKNTAARTWPTC